MSTVKKSTRAKAKAEPVAIQQPPTVMMIGVDSIYPSEMNPRRIKANDPTIAELAESLKARGMLHPVVVRHHESTTLPGQSNGCYELLAGRRRYEAAKLAGISAIPASVVDVDDDGALEICVTENLQREELNAIEEARGVQSLLDTGKTHAEVAGKLGKSERWIWRRVSLANLIARIADDVERGTLAEGMEDIEEYDVPAWFQAPTAALEMVARLPPTMQEELYEKYTIGYTVDDLREVVERMLRDLKEAPWMASENYYAKKCARCQKRTDAQAMLFEDMADDGARCLDGECWAEQRAAWVDSERERIATEAGLQPDQMPVYGRYQDDDDEPDMPFWKTEEAKAGDEGAFTAIVVDRNGAISQVTRKPKTTIENTGSGLPTREDRVVFAYSKIVREQVKLNDAGTLSFTEVIALVTAFGTADNASSISRKPAWINYARAIGIMRQGGDLKAQLWEQVKQIFDHRLNCYSAWTINKELGTEADTICDLLGLDTEALKAEADAEVARTDDQKEDAEDEDEDEKDAEAAEKDDAE